MHDVLSMMFDIIYKTNTPTEKSFIKICSDISAAPEEVLSMELETVSEWLVENRLSLHAFRQNRIYFIWIRDDWRIQNSYIYILPVIEMSLYQALILVLHWIKIYQVLVLPHT